MNVIESIDVSKETLRELTRGRVFECRKYTMFAHTCSPLSNDCSHYRILCDKADIMVGFYASEDIHFDMTIDTCTSSYHLVKNEFTYALFEMYALPLISSMYTPISLCSSNLKNIYIVYAKLVDTLDAFELIKNKYACKSANTEKYVVFASGKCRVCTHLDGVDLSDYIKMKSCPSSKHEM